jgi:hypothetical protein
VNQKLLSSLIFGSLTPRLKTNGDGSVDVFVGPRGECSVAAGWLPRSSESS